jgi:hypothetical protein
VIQWGVVDDRGEPQRIEIELTERAPVRRERRRHRDRTSTLPAAAPPAAPAIDAGQRPSSHYSDREPHAVFDPAGAQVVTSDPDQIGGGPLATERSRLVAATLTVGVIALFVGWALGRSGDDGEAARTVDATARVSTATTVAETVLPGEIIPAAETPRPTPAPTTSRTPRTTTTTIPPVWEESTITIDPRLAGVTDRLVAVTAERELIELDLATGTLRTLDVPSWPTGQTPYAPVAGDDFVAVQFDDGRPITVLVGDATTPRPITSFDPWATFWDIPGRTVWTLSSNLDLGRPTQLIESTVDGEPTGRTIDLRGMFLSGLVDPAGGIIVGEGSIGVYSVSPEGSRRIADGRPLALGVGHVLTYSCGDTLDDCSVQLVDRATGSSRPVLLTDGVSRVSLLNGWWGSPTWAPQVTLDGGAAMIALTDRGDAEVTVIDTVTGEVTRFASSSRRAPYPSSVWSSDERWLFVLVDGVATAYDRTTGEQFPISAELPETSALTIRITG